VSNEKKTTAGWGLPCLARQVHTAPGLSVGTILHDEVRVPADAGPTTLAGVRRADQSLAIAPQRHDPRVCGTTHGLVYEIDARRVAGGPHMHRLLPQSPRQDYDTGRVCASVPLRAVRRARSTKATPPVVAVYRHDTPTQRCTRALIDESHAKVGLMYHAR